MNTRTKNMISVVALCAMLTSCKSSGDLAYLQKSTGNNGKIDASGSLYEAHIKPKDILSITVVTSEPGVSNDYNLLVPQISDVSNNGTLYSMPTIQPYMVDNDGNIDFPILGKIKVVGLTRYDLEAQIQKKLEFAFSKERPIITIRIINYSVNILGEVSRPGKYSDINDRLTIFEGLAMAGDLTLYGRRDNVKVLRERADGSKILLYVNLNEKNIVNSPAYYLEQNDVVYVEPNKSRSRSSNINAGETLSISAISIVISLASLVINILR